MNSYHYLFKFIVIGDTGVGKSCLVLQFIESKTKEKHDVTIGVQFGSRCLSVMERNIALQIWDTAGQQNFRSITKSYYRSAIGAILVYDITKRDTFTHVRNWLDEAKANGNPNMQILLVGNKNDLVHERVVTQQQGSQLAKENGLNFIQINTKDYSKVEQAFMRLTASILLKIDNNSILVNKAVGIKIGNLDNTAFTSKKQKGSKIKHKKQCC